MNFMNFLTEKWMKNQRSREQIILLGIIVFVFVIFLKTIRVTGILEILVIGQEEDLNSIEILYGVISLLMEGWNCLVISLLFVLGLIYYLRVLRIGWLRKNLVTVMNAIVYLSAISLFVERIKPLFFTVPLFFLIVSRISDLWLNNRADLLQKINKHRIPIYFFLLLFILYIIGIIQVQTGVANEIRSSIPIFHQLISITPVYHALIFYLVLVLNNWKTSEYEIFINIVLVISVFLFVESLLSFYFKLDFLVDVSLGIGMFQGAFMAGYHKVARIAMVIGFFALYMFSRSKKIGYLLVFVFAILICFSTLNRSAIGAFFIGIAVVLIQLFYTNFASISVKQKNRIVYVFVLFILIIGVLLISITGQVRNSIVGQEINIAQIVRTLTGRLILMARGLEVFIDNFWIGTGAQNVSDYLSSKSIPTNISLYVHKRLYEAFGNFMDSFNNSEDWLFEFFSGRTIHNLWLNFILEWGITGLFIVAYVLCKGLSWTRTAINKMTARDKNSIPLGIFLALGISLSLSMLFTIKFRYYSLFVMILLFTDLLAQNKDGVLDKEKVPNLFPSDSDGVNISPV